MNLHGSSDITASAPAEIHGAVFLRLPAWCTLPPPLVTVTWRDIASIATSTNTSPHRGCYSMGSWAKGELNRGPHLEMCREGWHLCWCAHPMPVEPKRGVRMQKTPRNTRGQVGEETQGNKRHFLKCTSYFIPMNNLARPLTRSVVWADTNHCIMRRTW